MPDIRSTFSKLDLPGLHKPVAAPSRLGHLKGRSTADLNSLIIIMRLAPLKTGARRMSTASSFHPHLPAGPATLVGRCWVENVGPCVITLDEETGICYDISQRVPTMTDLLNSDNPVDVARGYRSGGGSAIGNVNDLMDGNQTQMHLLAPCDLSPVKACGGECD